MFSKELENLIQATLEDGVLEEYEKAALVKRAQNEGVDLTELEIYIQSILQRRKRELAKEEDAKQEEIDKKKQEALGPVCPKCHKQVPPLTLKCDCGYEFTKDKHESSVKILSEKIDKIQSRNLKGEPDSYEWIADRDLREQEVLDAISLFPIPNTKEDIIEFLALSAPNVKKKNQLLGTVFGRLAICLGILVILLFLTWFLLPDTYTVTRDVSKGFFSEAQYETFVEKTQKPEIIGISAILGIALSIVFANGFDKETLVETRRWNKRADVWKAKFDQVMMKGRSLRGDPEFTQQLDYYEDLLNKK